jgi:hypothetical protein
MSSVWKRLDSLNKRLRMKKDLRSPNKEIKKKIERAQIRSRREVVKHYELERNKIDDSFISENLDFLCSICKRRLILAKESRTRQVCYSRAIRGVQEAINRVREQKEFIKERRREEIEENIEQSVQELHMEIEAGMGENLSKLERRKAKLFDMMEIDDYLINEEKNKSVDDTIL